jgi:hypothetical protein
MQGCDGSVLLDKSAQNPHPEKEAPANIGLAAFDILEAIKADIEKKCPGVCPAPTYSSTLPATPPKS